MLVLHDERRKDDTGRGLKPGLACALLLDLARRQLVDLDEDGYIVPRPGQPPSEAVLADASEAIRRSKRPREARYWIGKLAAEVRPLHDRVAQRLVDVGILSKESHRLLGLIPSRRYPERDPAPETKLRKRLRPRSSAASNHPSAQRS